MFCTCICTTSTISDFKNELKSEISNLILNNNLMTDPDPSYEAFEDFVIWIKDKHKPIKTVRFDKHKHKLSGWPQGLSNR